MILFVDHFDSFSNNLISWFEAQNANTLVITHNNLSSIKSFQNINGVVFSPGPGSPESYHSSLAFYKKIPNNIPFLGVCLGLQILLLAEGASISQVSQTPIHGRQIQLTPINQSKFFKNNELNGIFVLYNSLGCKINDPVFLKNMLPLACHSGFIMATEHKILPRIGVQFHPESFASPGGCSILNTFLRLISC